MRKYLAVLAIVMCTLWIAMPAAADTQLITNGGFETGDFSGWTLTGNTANPGVNYFVDAFDANSGAYGAGLGAIDSPLTLSQSFATSVATGNLLTISFAVALNFDGTPVPDPGKTGLISSFVVTLNGDTLLTLDNTSVAGAYEVFTYTLGAPDGPYTLSFTSQNDLDFWSLDDVSVTAPEPQSLLLLASGMSGLVFVRRRRA